MEPIDIELKEGKYVIVHRCQKCGFIRRNKVCDTDDFDSVIALSRRKTEMLKG